MNPFNIYSFHFSREISNSDSEYRVVILHVVYCKISYCSAFAWHKTSLLALDDQNLVNCCPFNVVLCAFASLT